MTTEKHMFLRIMLVPVFYQHVGWLWESSLKTYSNVLNKTRNYIVPRLYRNQTKIYRLPKMNKQSNLGDLRAYIATEVAIL